MYVCLSPQKGALLHTYGEKQGYRPLSPVQTEGLHTMRCGLVPQGDCYDPAISTPVTRSLRQDTFHLGLGRPEPH